MNYLRELSIVVPALWAISSQANEPRLEPARLENAAEVARLMSFPDTAKEGDVVIIRCGTSIGTFIPAQHDGKAVEGTYVEAWYTDS